MHRPRASRGTPEDGPERPASPFRSACSPVASTVNTHCLTARIYGIGRLSARNSTVSAAVTLAVVGGDLSQYLLPVRIRRRCQDAVAKNKIDPASKPTHPEWAEKNGFKLAERSVPQAWILPTSWGPR